MEVDTQSKITTERQLWVVQREGASNKEVLYELATGSHVSLHASDLVFPHMYSVFRWHFLDYTVNHPPPPFFH